MKLLLSYILVALLACLIAGCAATAPRQNVLDNINAVLPEGWHTLDRGDGIWIIRGKPVQMVGFLSALGGNEKPLPRTYQIVLSNAEHISPADFDVINKSNEELKALVEALRKESMAIPHEKDKTRHPSEWTFHTRTKAEESTVDEYRTKSPRVKRLPDFYLGDCAFSMDLGFMLDTFTVPEEKQECLEVLRSVLKLLNKYEGDSTR